MAAQANPSPLQTKFDAETVKEAGALLSDWQNQWINLRIGRLVSVMR
jgi:hypothetical protein